MAENEAPGWEVAVGERLRNFTGGTLYLTVRAPVAWVLTNRRQEWVIENALYSCAAVAPGPS